MSASTGTLVAAGLESAGYVAQSMVLSDFSTLLIAGAVLIFVILSSKTLFSVVVQGQYMQALKLLVYPILVVSMLATTTFSGGAQWQFGNVRGDQSKLKSFVDNSTQSQVSLPFELFNRFVSGVSQMGIGLILDNPVSDTVLFSVRQQLLDSILNVDLVSAGLKSLVHEGLQGKCGSWMDAARKIARGNRDPLYMGTPDYNNAYKFYNNMGEPSMRLQTTGPGYTYVMNLLTAIGTTGPSRTDAEDLVRKMCEGTNGVLQPTGASPKDTVDAPISCSQIWCWSGLGLVLEARAALEDAVKDTVESNDTYKSLAPESKAYILQKILEDIAKKVSPDKEFEFGYDNDPSILPIVIAGYLLKRELGRSPQNGLYTEFAENSGVGVSAYQPQTNLSENDRSILRDSGSEYSLTISAANQMLSMAYALPYLQGVILFSLALTFPFFVITTAVMRQGGGLLFWAGAWVWAKSWDIGWAVVMLVDQLLWELMPHRSIYVPLPSGLHSPITVMESAFDADPTYSLATYYLLISMLLLSIPTVMGQLFLRSAQSMSQILIGAVQQYGAQPAAEIESKKQAYETTRNIGGQSVTVIDGKAYNYWKLGAEPSSLTRTPTVLPKAGDNNPQTTPGSNPQTTAALPSQNVPGLPNNAGNRLPQSSTTANSNQPQLGYENQTSNRLEA